MFVYDRELTLEQGFAVANQPRHSRLVGGVEVSLASGIELFRHLMHGPIKCYQCGCTADRWIASRHNKGRSKPVLNLYGTKYVKTKHGRVERTVMMTRDHIIPKSEGGVDDVRNLRPACEFCNVGRGSKMTADEVAFMNTHPELIDPERARKGAEARERQRLEKLAAAEARALRNEDGCTVDQRELPEVQAHG